MEREQLEQVAADLPTVRVVLDMTAYEPLDDGDKAWKLAAQKKGSSEEKLAKAEQRIDELTQENSKLHEQVAEAERLHEFDEVSGVLFKRRVGGGYHDAVYCPKCRIAMMEVVYGGIYCDGCKWRAPIRANDVPALRASLTTP